MVRLYLLDLYDDAELERKKTAALFAGFVTKKSRDADLPVPTKDGIGAFAEDPPPESTLAPVEPGSFQVLEEGEDVTFSTPADVGGSYEAFIWRNLLSIAAGCGVPYADTTSDTSKANYSSDRADQIKFRRRMDQFQHLTLVFQMCRPIWERWFQTAVLSGALPIKPKDFLADPGAYVGVKWIPPKWDWVDPLKDRKAIQVALEIGTMARSDAIEMEGEEPEDTDARIAADRKREIAMDLGFRPVTIRENVNIGATADTPDDAVDAARDGGETKDDPDAGPEVAVPPPPPKSSARRRA